MSALGRLMVTLVVVVVIAGGVALVPVVLPGPKATCTAFLADVNRGDINSAMERCDPQTQSAYGSAKKLADTAVGIVGKVVGVNIPIGVSDVIDNMPLLTEFAKEMGTGSFSGTFVDPVTVRSKGSVAIVYGDFEMNASDATGETAQQTSTMLIPLKRYGLQWKIVLADVEALKEIQAAFPDEMSEYSADTTSEE